MLYSRISLPAFLDGREGLRGNDPAGRGIIVWHAVAYIVSQRPTFFILENVKGLVGRFPDLFNTLIDTLRSIPKFGRQASI